MRVDLTVVALVMFSVDGVARAEVELVEEVGGGIVLGAAAIAGIVRRTYS